MKNNKTRYAYHISDEYFEKAQDKKLMKNKEDGQYRPTYYCFVDEKTSLLWMIPVSSKVEKYKRIAEKQKKKFGQCRTLVFGNFDRKRAVFLLQNMFPVRSCYIDHIHTRNGNPVPVKPYICKEVNRKAKQILKLQRKGVKIVFPDIERLERIMLEEERSKAK